MNLAQSWDSVNIHGGAGPRWPLPESSTLPGNRLAYTSSHHFQKCLPVAFKWFLSQAVLPRNILPRRHPPAALHLPTTRTGMVRGHSQAPRHPPGAPRPNPGEGRSQPPHLLTCRAAQSLLELETQREQGFGHSTEERGSLPRESWRESFLVGCAQPFWHQTAPGLLRPCGCPVTAVRGSESPARLGWPGARAQPGTRTTGPEPASR